MSDREKHGTKGIYLLSGQSEFFDPPTTPCVVCGSPFELRRYRGRPQKFCGDFCRLQQSRAQKLAWQQRRTLVHKTEGTNL